MNAEARRTSRSARLLLGLLDLAGAVLILLAVVSAITDGLRWTVVGVRITANRPSRLLVEAFAILLVRLVVSAPCRAIRRGVFFGVYACFLVGLVVDSTPHRSGDAGEYIAMALNMARLRPPAPSPDELRSIEDRLADVAGYGRLNLAMPDFRGADGRQDFPHFWFYPLLAAPWVAAAEAVGAHPNHGFTVLNVALLLAATIGMARRLPLELAALLAAGPIVWWADKAHTEIFTFALLSFAILAIDDRPEWSLVSIGAAATQNPPLVVVFALALAYVWSTRGLRDRRVWMGVLAGVTLASFHPLYYRWHLGVWSSLRTSVTPHWPTVTELLVPIADPNLGMLIHFPALAVAIVVALGVLITRGDRAVPIGALCALSAAALALLISFAQTANINHGGTPGPSRYGLWLIPITIPLLSQGWPRSTRGRVTGALMVGLSVAWSSYAFHPRLQDRYLAPTSLADRLWTTAPGINNPPPEIFTERASGWDGRYLLPLTTGACEKVLLANSADGRPLWPVPCEPRPVPDACRAEETVCYANRTREGYDFVPVPRHGFGFSLAREWARADAAATIPMLEDIRWGEVLAVRPWTSGSFVVAHDGVAWVHAVQSERQLIVWINEIEPGASVTIRTSRAMEGFVADRGRRRVLRRLITRGGETALLELPAAEQILIRLDAINLERVRERATRS
ncbi:MAG: hypothetical protein HYX76_15775 [Acidobacteria bacterium]|nr:hypothetical protein [Acidobacteriota bacterium]